LVECQLLFSGIADFYSLIFEPENPRDEREIAKRLIEWQTVFAGE